MFARSGWFTTAADRFWHPWREAAVNLMNICAVVIEFCSVPGAWRRLRHAKAAGLVLKPATS
jgi:hypothetical protein